jgi:hypothetical protein
MFIKENNWKNRNLAENDTTIVLTINQQNKISEKFVPVKNWETVKSYIFDEGYDIDKVL